MIQANELRINNLLYFNGTHKDIGKVTGISNFFSLHYSVNINNRDNITYSLNELQPIPLTEEILLRCGFEYKHTNFLHNDSTLEWYFGLTGMFLPSIYKHTIKSDNIKGVKYLHQLQNLYLALTGKELKINL